MAFELSIAGSALERLCQRQISGPELMDVIIAHGMLPQMYRELVIDQAIATITCSSEELEQAQSQFYEANKISDPAVRSTWLAQQGMSPEQLDVLATRSLRLEKFKWATWGNKLEAHFLSVKGQLDQVMYSLLRTKDFGIAQELFFRIKAGEQSFADAAREYSQGPEAQSGGLIGPMAITNPHPELAAKLRSAQPGELLPPTRLGDWIVIVRLEQLITARLDEPTRRTLLDQLYQTWLRDTVSQLMAQSTPANPAATSAAPANAPLLP
jgi:parvulin-like peptidyl-prolyl isomerase